MTDSKIVPIDDVLFEELAEPDLGAEVEGGFQAQVGDRPIGIKLRQIFDELRESIPTEYTKLLLDYEVWHVPHRAATRPHSGFGEPTSVGIEVRYTDEGTTSIVALLPSFQYVVHGELHVRGTFAANGSARVETPDFLESVKRKSYAGLTFG